MKKIVSAAAIAAIAFSVYAASEGVAAKTSALTAIGAEGRNAKDELDWQNDGVGPLWSDPVGSGKGFSQIKDIPDSYVVNDDVELGIGRKIPLWLFGLMY